MAVMNFWLKQWEYSNNSGNFSFISCLDYPLKCTKIRKESTKFDGSTHSYVWRIFAFSSVFRNFYTRTRRNDLCCLPFGENAEKKPEAGVTLCFRIMRLKIKSTIIFRIKLVKRQRIP